MTLAGSTLYVFNAAFNMVLNSRLILQDRSNKSDIFSTNYQSDKNWALLLKINKLCLQKSLMR